MSSISIAERVSGVHSKQPWFVLSAAKQYSLYLSEQPEVSHFYGFQADKDAPLTFAIPDGCVDILFDCDEARPLANVCGTTLEATRADCFVHQHRYFGVRFKPGMMPDFLDVSAAELINSKRQLSEVVKGADRLLEQVASADSFIEQVSSMKRFLQGKSTRNFSAPTRQSVQHILQQRGNIRIKQLETMTGYTSRTLQRLFHSDLGMTPKAFSRIIRCQNAVYDINHSRDVAFSDLACDLGFSDQSHFLREFKRLVSTTPMDYQNRIRHQTYLGRIRYQ